MAFAELVALSGFLLKYFEQKPDRDAIYLLIAGALLQMIQAPIDFKSETPADSTATGFSDDPSFG